MAGRERGVRSTWLVGRPQLRACGGHRPRLRGQSPHVSPEAYAPAGVYSRFASFCSRGCCLPCRSRGAGRLDAPEEVLDILPLRDAVDVGLALVARRSLVGLKKVPLSGAQSDPTSVRLTAED